MFHMGFTCRRFIFLLKAARLENLIHGVASGRTGGQNQPHQVTVCTCEEGEGVTTKLKRVKEGLCDPVESRKCSVGRQTHNLDSWMTDPVKVPWGSRTLMSWQDRTYHCIFFNRVASNYLNLIHIAQFILWLSDFYALTLEWFYWCIKDASPDSMTYSCYKFTEC